MLVSDLQMMDGYSGEHLGTFESESSNALERVLEKRSRSPFEIVRTAVNF
jgi:hypothetical protein